MTDPTPYPVEMVPRGPQPQPEQRERRLQPPVRLRQLSRRDLRAVLVRAVKETVADSLPNVAKAVAFSLFLAIPSAFVAVLGVFGLVASRSTIAGVMNSLHGAIPGSAMTLIHGELVRLTTSHSGSLWAFVLGLAVGGRRTVDPEPWQSGRTRRSGRSLVSITGDLEWLAIAEPVDTQPDADSLLVEAVVTLGAEAAVSDRVDRLVLAYRRAKR